MTDNKLGMFIHWGLYAATGLHEQAFARYDLDRAYYEGLAKNFDPSEYDPEKWVLLAKEAGMQYICITTKHHDGFCMWDTKYTDFNIMHTPYGKDILKELSDACRKHGMLLSLYYSIPDWNHPYGYNPASTHQWKAKRENEVNTEIYREFVKNQITELLSNYGPIYTLFWDIPPHIEDRSLNELARKLQPGIFINDRGYDEGDFSTPEREIQAIPDTTRFERMTEACNSVGVQSWGYRKEEDFYSLSYLTRAIDRIMAMGGSYLLNVGPNEKGVITEEYASRIQAIGDWYNRMEGCLVGHEADPFDYGVKRDPCLITKKNGKSYFHFYDGLISNAVNMKNVPSMPTSVRLMNDGSSLSYGYDLLPENFNFDTGKMGPAGFHIKQIPVDKFAGEPIVIEMTFA